VHGTITQQTRPFRALHIIITLPQPVYALLKAEEDEERRNQEQTTKIIVLTCREHSVTYPQFADCVAGL
jgi:hypothetical protein